MKRLAPIIFCILGTLPYTKAFSAEINLELDFKTCSSTPSIPLTGLLGQVVELGGGKYQELARQRGLTVQEFLIVGLVDKIKKDYGKDCLPAGLTLDGTIDERTLDSLKFGWAVLTSLGKGDPTIIWLNSGGGLVKEAMSIGDQIAEWGLWAIVREGASCFSSCTLVYLAAPYRFALSRGVHRPFSEEISAEDGGYADYLEKFNVVIKDVQLYSSKYGVSSNYVDAIASTPSEKIRMLSYDELEKWGLAGKNVAKAEYDRSREIKLCGKSENDYFIKRDNFIAFCQKEHSFVECGVLADSAFPDWRGRRSACNDKIQKK